MPAAVSASTAHRKPFRAETTLTRKPSSELQWLFRENGMKRFYATLLYLMAMPFSAFACGTAYAAPKPKVIPFPKLRAALYNAQTVYFMDDDAASAIGSNELAVRSYPSFVSSFNAVQGMNRYQMLPSTTGADLIFSETAYGGVQVLDGKTLEPLGALSFFANGEKKYTPILLGQLRDYAGDSKASKAIVPIPPTPLIVRADQGSANKAVVPHLQSAHSVFILDKETFPAPKKTPYQPGQMVAMLATNLTAWARYQPVSSVADADLVVTFAVADGCVANGTKWEREGSWMKVPVADFKCDGAPSLGLLFRDAKTLQMLGSIWIDQPDMSIKPNQPNPRDLTFEKLIDVWKSKATPQVP
jgi:hypothetical protein